jgi:hypothetical protein
MLETRCLNIREIHVDGVECCAGPLYFKKTVNHLGELGWRVPVPGRKHGLPVAVADIFLVLIQ